MSASSTTFHSYRSVFLTFSNKSNSFKQYVPNAHDASAIAAIPSILLAIGSMFIGYPTKDMIIGIGSSFRGQALFILTENISYAEAEYLPYHIKLIPFIFSHFGILFAYHTSFFLSDNSKTEVAEDKGETTQGLIGTSAWEQQSFQKNLVLHKLTTTPQVIKLHTFFNQK